MIYNGPECSGQIRVNYARPDWTAYLAARDADLRPTPTAKGNPVNRTPPPDDPPATLWTLRAIGALTEWQALPPEAVPLAGFDAGQPLVFPGRAYRIAMRALPLLPRSLRRRQAASAAARLRSHP
jgi:hypothetical protein